MDRAYSQACENNKTFILGVLQRVLGKTSKLLEIGSGTGQHAVYMAPRLPHLQWFTSDRQDNHPHILDWIADYPSDNLQPPISFDIGRQDWPVAGVDGVFSANTAHIMQPEEVSIMMSMIATRLPVDGVFCQYGPFNMNGEYTSDSNLAFDQSLRESGYGGLVDIEQLQQWAGPQLKLMERIAMPANNMALVWQKIQP